jgi:hypothetical protein
MADRYDFQAGPAKAFESMENDSESCIAIECSITTYWNIAFLRAQVEQYEQENAKVFPCSIKPDRARPPAWAACA